MSFISVTESEVFEGSLSEDTGIVRGVKLLGLRSKNRRNYNTKGVQTTAKTLLEGARVYIDHPAAPETPRSYRDSFGVIEGVEFRPGAGHFGNIKYNPDHSLSKQFVWDVKNNPTALGMSINAKIDPGKSDQNGDTIVESLLLVRSVDIVTKPATADGIFESAQEDIEESEIMDLKTLREKHPLLVDEILESHKASTKESDELTILKKSLADALEQANALKAEAETRKTREAVESDFSTILDISIIGDDKDLRKEILECACQMTEESRKPYRSVVEKFAKLTPIPGDSDDDDSEPADTEEQEEEEKPVKPTYRPGAKKPAGGLNLAKMLGVKVS